LYLREQQFIAAQFMGGEERTAIAIPAAHRSEQEKEATDARRPKQAWASRNRRFSQELALRRRRMGHGRRKAPPEEVARGTQRTFIAYPVRHSSSVVGALGMHAGVALGGRGPERRRRGGQVCRHRFRRSTTS